MKKVSKTNILNKIVRLSILSLLFFSPTMLFSQNQPVDTEKMLVRIAEIEVFPEFLDNYLKEAQKVGEISVKEEKGVICIFPMQVKRDQNSIRILEIYSDMEAYDLHIKSVHFQKYKKGTLHMIKSLNLVDTTPLDPAAMTILFKKLSEK